MHHLITSSHEVLATASALAIHIPKRITLAELHEPPIIEEHLYQQLCWLLVQNYGVKAVERMQRNGAHPQTRVLFVAGRLYVTSMSECGRIHQTDGASCSCRGATHATCWHRTFWHLLTLWTALVDPTFLYRFANEREEFGHDRP